MTRVTFEYPAKINKRAENPERKISYDKATETLGVQS